MIGTLFALTGAALLIGKASAKCNERERQEEARRLNEFRSLTTSYPRSNNHHQLVRRENEIIRQKNEQIRIEREKARKAIIRANEERKARESNYKKVKFFDLYREIDNYLGRLAGSSDGGGITRLINGYRNSYPSDYHLKRWIVLREYRNKLSHDKTKWVNVDNPNPSVMEFMNNCYFDFKSNPKRYKRIMNSGLISYNRPRRISYNKQQMDNYRKHDRYNSSIYSIY